jgi:hypothetical protein
MVDTLLRLAALSLRPVEKYWSWKVKRGYRKGRYLRPSDIGSGAVTTRKR